MNSRIYFELCIISLVFLLAMRCEAVDTTIGFASQPLDQTNFEIQKPYDVPVHQRYDLSDGVHKLWVLKTDKPHTRSSKTNPRTEIRIRGYDYSSGVWQFEGYGYVPSETTGVCVMQVFGSSPPYATTTMLVVKDTSLYYYRRTVILSDLYNKWFRLNVIHDVDNNTVQVYIDGVLKYVGSGHGGKSHYFKCGVYSQNDGSSYMESHWRDIRIFKKT